MKKATYFDAILSKILCRTAKSYENSRYNENRLLNFEHCRYHFLSFFLSTPTMVRINLTALKAIYHEFKTTTFNYKYIKANFTDSTALSRSKKVYTSKEFRCENSIEKYYYRTNYKLMFMV